MNKRILGLIIIGIVIAGMSFVSSSISGVNFVTPVSGDNISGTSYVVNWTNTDAWGGLYLAYQVNGCQSGSGWNPLGGPFDANETTYSWDVSSLSDGVYCLRLDQLGNVTYSGNFTIDNTNPIASLSAGEPYICNEGDVITLDGSNSLDSETGIEKYEWELDGDGLYDDAVGVSVNYTCGDGPSLKSVSLKVTDYAGNSDTASSTVNISNVAPVCNGISGFTDFAVGEQVVLTENATDIADSLVYTWDFNDSNGFTGNPANHTFTSAGIYNVSVTVSDGTDSCKDSLEITIVNPIVLSSQEVMALQNLDANFTPNEGSVANSFATGLTGGVSCAKRVQEPVNMSITGSGNDCVVTWNNVENAYNGVNTMVVRVDNGTDYEYYTFDTTVWSWKINLVPGWNLISIPVVPEDASIQSVLLDQLYDSLPGGYEYVVWSYQYDPSEGKNRWYKSRRTGYGDLDTIEPGKAYWINLTTADVLYGYGDKLIAATTPPETTIVSGWNLIGHYGLLSILGEGALKSLEGFYSSVLDSNGNPVNVSADNFVPGQGYWVSTKDLLEGEEIKYTPSDEAYNFN